MEKSEHVLMVGEGAEKFAASIGVPLVDEKYFYTEERWKNLQKVKDAERRKDSISQKEKHGTVGACALDKSGNLAGATSTGGMTNKKFGRVGDAPIIGAGTYANNQTCAVSATGHGEYFIRSVVAYDISALMLYKNLSVQNAADEVVMKKLTALGGTGGIVAMDAHGNVAMPFNTEGMYRGYKRAGEKAVVKIYKDE
jgi:L-asparaginase / beta-aspartyl-peptidase